MAKVYVGIGHGGSDPGACANGYKEKDLTLSIGRACYDELLRNGVEAKISRTDDRDVTIAQKVAQSDAFGADYCLDIHINAGGGNGCEIYYHHLGGNSKKLAAQIEKALKAIGQKSRGLKVKMNSSGTADYFGMIRDTEASAVLVECGFIDTKEDLARFDTPAEQKKFGVAIAHGILAQLGITPAQQAPQQPAEPAQPAQDQKPTGGAKPFKDFRYRNGSTREPVYRTIADAKARKNAQWYVEPYADVSATAYIGRVDSYGVVLRRQDYTWKTGFVAYEGGVPITDAVQCVQNAYKNGSTKEYVYADTVSCLAGKNSIGYLYPWEECVCLYKIDGCYVVVYNANGTKKIGMVRYNGGIDV